MALKELGIDVVDGQQVFMEARRIKTVDEISLLATRRRWSTPRMTSFTASCVRASGE